MPIGSRFHKDTEAAFETNIFPHSPSNSSRNKISSNMSQNVSTQLTSDESMDGGIEKRSMKKS